MQTPFSTFPFLYFHQISTMSITITTPDIFNQYMQLYEKWAICNSQNQHLNHELHNLRCSENSIRQLSLEELTIVTNFMRKVTIIDYDDIKYTFILNYNLRLYFSVKHGDTDSVDLTPSIIIGTVFNMPNFVRIFNCLQRVATQIQSEPNYFRALCLIHNELQKHYTIVVGN